MEIISPGGDPSQHLDRNMDKEGPTIPPSSEKLNERETVSQKEDSRKEDQSPSSKKGHPGKPSKQGYHRNNTSL